MQTALYNDWYVRTDNRIGPYTILPNQLPTSEQKHNAEKVYNILSGYGWSLSAICGILGNMTHESTINPAYIQANNRWRLPNSAENLSDVPNSVMQNFYMQYYGDDERKYGVGLVQWDGKGITRQKYVGWCINENYIWYDGEAGCGRLKYEHDNNKQWTPHTYYGITWTWDNYVTNTRSPEDSARIWVGCYEISGGISERQGNARYWYDYFQDVPPTPPTPDEWITGDTFANLATAYDPDITGVQIPYSQMDCIAYVQTVWRDITAVGPSGKLVTNISPLQFGTNSLWRENVTPYPAYTFNTTSPDNQNPTPVLWYKDTISNCIAQFGSIPTGTLLFHKISEAGPPAIRPEYAGDGIGNFAHVGIYIGNNQVMQSGGMDSSSVPGGGVHRSAYNSNAWNYCAFVVYVNCTGDSPEPPGPEPPGPDIPLTDLIMILYSGKKKGVVKNVRKWI